MSTNLRLYAAPVALLLMATGLAVPRASAEPDSRPGAVTASFAYDRSAPAAQVYAELENAAERLCAESGPRPLFLRKHERACVAEAVQDAVGRIGRIDIADLHDRARGQGQAIRTPEA